MGALKAACCESALEYGNTGQRCPLKHILANHFKHAATCALEDHFVANAEVPVLQGTTLLSGVHRAHHSGDTTCHVRQDNSRPFGCQLLLQLHPSTHHNPSIHTPRCDGYSPCSAPLSTVRRSPAARYGHPVVCACCCHLTAPHAGPWLHHTRAPSASFQS